MQTAPDTSALPEALVIDSVCRMTIDPARAAAREMVDGKPVHFCSEGCRHCFPADPAA